MIPEMYVAVEYSRDECRYVPVAFPLHPECVDYFLMDNLHTVVFPLTVTHWRRAETCMHCECEILPEPPPDIAAPVTLTRAGNDFDYAEPLPLPAHSFQDGNGSLDTKG